MNNVHSLPTNLPMDFTDRINSVGNFVGKNGTSLFFCFVVIIIFSAVIPSVNIERVFPSVEFVGNLPTKIFSRYFRLYLSIFWQCPSFSLNSFYFVLLILLLVPQPVIRPLLEILTSTNLGQTIMCLELKQYNMMLFLQLMPFASYKLDSYLVY